MCASSSTVTATAPNFECNEIALLTVSTTLCTTLAIHKVAAHLCTAHICTYLVLHLTAVFTVSLELQGHCSDQLTLICRHSDVLTDPNWIHNGTARSGQFLDTAFPGSVYSVQTSIEHRVTVSGVDSMQALDSYIIQCAYSIQNTLIKSNAVKYSFIPPGWSHGYCGCICILQNLYCI